MRARETHSWQVIGVALSDISEMVSDPKPCWADRIRRLLDSLPGEEAVEAQVPAASTSAQSRAIPALEVLEALEEETLQASALAISSTPGTSATPGLNDFGRAVSIFAVNPAKVKAGDFFQLLTFQRNDPTREAPGLFEPVSPASPVETCRRIFAYSIPWDERGGSVSGPADTAALPVHAGFQSIAQLSAAATEQALHLATKMKREKTLLAAYTSDPEATSSDRAAAFFITVPWLTRRPHQTPESKIGLPS